MHNYEHEIPCPDDRAIKKFLWSDYFHDSVIESVDFDQSREDCLIMRLRCDRDERACWNRFGGDYDKWRAHIEENAEKYTYLLRFQRVVYLEERMINDGRREYINARFKDTALLRRLQKQSKHSLYHLRIQTDCGYMDLIFSGLEIRKVIGRVSYAEAVNKGRLPLLRGERSLQAEIRAEEYEGMPEDDFERFLILMNMDQNGNEHMDDAVRICMDDDRPCEDAKLYAAHLMGRIGKCSDIPALTRMLFEIEDELADDLDGYRMLLLHRRNIQDAIELIRYRAQKAKKTASSRIDEKNELN